MAAKFSFEGDTCVLTDFNRARPFSSFLPGIAGEYGKPMWVFTTNRGQCVSSFGVSNKNSAMLEFFPANKAYAMTPLVGFRTFLRIGGANKPVYEPFQVNPAPGIEQVLRLRPAEIEMEETNRALGLRIRVVVFGVANETLPVLLRTVTLENIGRKPLSVEVVDGLPQIVPFGLQESLLKQMSRTMEAFVETLHVKEQLPLFKLKVEPSDRPEMERIEGGFFSFTLSQGKSCPVIVDPESIFGSDTSFQRPEGMVSGNGFLRRTPLTECRFASAFSATTLRLPPKAAKSLQSYYGQTDLWQEASAFRRRVEKETGYAERKRSENWEVVRRVTDVFGLHSALPVLDAYTRQAFLDNTLRGGQPMILAENGSTQVFHYYSRKHGDMERDYNFFELSPTPFSQGNGNFRDVNQNRRSEGFCFPGLGAANIETFFNLLQLDGFNPLVIQFEKFFVEKSRLDNLDSVIDSRTRDEWHAFLSKPFNPGELYEKLVADGLSIETARSRFETILCRAHKIQDAVHGEGFWVDHWTYNLDLLENFTAVYPDQVRTLLLDRRDFTYFDNDHVVQPRRKKYVQIADGRIRQLKAVVQDDEKSDLLRRRKEDPFKVRTNRGTGTIYRTSLLAKILNLIAIKAASLDPFGIGLEMEAEKPGWCDALNGLPALFGSSVNEAFELQRWVLFVQEFVKSHWGTRTSTAVAEEVADLMKAVGEALAQSRPDDFFKTWDALASAKENFRERTRLGVSGRDVPVSRQDIEHFLAQVLQALISGLGKARAFGDLVATYFIHEVVEFDLVAMPPADPWAKEKRLPAVNAKRFKQTAISPFLEGPVHALRTFDRRESALKLYKAVRASELYDRELGMYRLNVPLKKESFEIGRAKIFTPGWLENESIFLHMHYKFLLEVLRSGLIDEFFTDLKTGLVAFQPPNRYGRSILENSSFIASSRFPDPKLHGAGFVARLSGATAEWISIVLHLGLGRRPFRWTNATLSFEPEPTLPEWLFSKKADGDFGKDTFGFKLFGSTWVVYHNPSRKSTYGPSRVKPVRYSLRTPDGREVVHEGPALPDVPTRELRDGRFSRLTIELN